MTIMRDELRKSVIVVLLLAAALVTSAQARHHLERLGEANLSVKICTDTAHCDPSSCTNVSIRSDQCLDFPTLNESMRFFCSDVATADCIEYSVFSDEGPDNCAQSRFVGTKYHYCGECKAGQLQECSYVQESKQQTGEDGGAVLAVSTYNCSATNCLFPSCVLQRVDYVGVCNQRQRLEQVYKCRVVPHPWYGGLGCDPHSVGGGGDLVALDVCSFALTRSYIFHCPS